MRVRSPASPDEWWPLIHPIVSEFAEALQLHFFERAFKLFAKGMPRRADQIELENSYR
jgi:hypothetical protein